MIKNTELRIGNLVHYNGLGGDLTTYRTVFAITPQSIWINDKIPLPEKKFEGIPLTEECLLKFGFNKGKYDAFLYPSCNYIVRSVQFGKPIQLNGINDMGWNIELSDNDNWIGLKRVQHIHHLQNFFFAINGFELTI